MVLATPYNFALFSLSRLRNGGADEVEPVSYVVRVPRPRQPCWSYFNLQDSHEKEAVSWSASGGRRQIHIRRGTTARRSFGAIPVVQNFGQTCAQLQCHSHGLLRHITSTNTRFRRERSGASNEDVEGIRKFCFQNTRKSRPKTGSFEPGSWCLKFKVIVYSSTTTVLKHTSHPVFEKKNPPTLVDL